MRYLVENGGGNDARHERIIPAPVNAVQAAPALGDVIARRARAA
jgi:hypothetical protein